VIRSIIPLESFECGLHDLIPHSHSSYPALLCVDHAMLIINTCAPHGAFLRIELAFSLVTSPTHHALLANDRDIDTPRTSSILHD